MGDRGRIASTVLLGLLALGIAAGCGSSGGVGVPGTTDAVSAPLFWGVKSASTAGGPYVRLDWMAAVDESGVAPSYRIYRSATSGGQDFVAAPVATAAAGATSAILAAPIGIANYYVVRAVDADGNADMNTVEIGVTAVVANRVAFVTNGGAGGTLGDPTSRYSSIQAAAMAVEAAGGGVVLVDAAPGGSTYSAAVDLSVPVASIGLYGGFARFSLLGAAPTGADILATRDVQANTTEIGPDGPLALGDLVRVDNGGTLTYVDGFEFRVDESDGPSVRASDANMQISCCSLYDSAFCEFGTTAITNASTTRIVGNHADDDGSETFVVGGGCTLLRFENNHVFDRSRVLSADEGTAALRVLPAGTTIHIAHNLLDAQNSGSTQVELDMREADALAGGALAIWIEGNEIRDHSSDGVRIDGYHRVGQGGSVDIVARYNLFNGFSSSGLELNPFEDGTDDPPTDVTVNVSVYDNQFLNGNGDSCVVNVGVSANRDTRVMCRDNVFSVSESEIFEVDDREGPTDDTSNGGSIVVDCIRNFHFGGGEEYSVDLGIPYGGRSVFNFVENTVLGTEEPALEIEARDRLGTTSSPIPFPNGLACINAFNNDLHGHDDEAIEIEDQRDSGGPDDSICICYVGHNLARNGSDGSDGAIELRYDADNGAFLIERNFCGAGGQDSTEVGIELETQNDALRNFVRVMNNVATLGSGGGIQFDSDGSPPQLINNTAAYAGQNGQQGLESDSNASNGDDQAFILNCIASHSGGGDVDREAGVSLFYSLIRDEAIPLGFGNLGGEPWFAKALQGINVFAVGGDDLRDLFTLLPTSPCVDAGHPAARYNDPDGSRNDMGAYGGPGAGPLGPLAAGSKIPLRFIGMFPAVELSTGAVLPSATEPLLLGFNAPVLQASIPGRIQVWNNGTLVNGSLTTELGGHLVKFTPATPLNVHGGQFVDVVIQPALEGQNGETLGRTEYYRFALRPAAALIEVEANDDGVPGVSASDLVAAQVIGVGPTSAPFELSGALASSDDVDVYAITGSAGARISATILDARMGGGNEGAVHLDLYDSAGRIVTVGRRDLWNELGAGDGDPFLDHILPATATYYLVVTNPDLGAPPLSYTLMGVLD